MVDFVKLHPIAHVLGTHIEQGSQAYFDYPRNTIYQPKEHVLELSRAHVFELDEAFRKMTASRSKSCFRISQWCRGLRTSAAGDFEAGDGLGLQPGAANGLADRWSELRDDSGLAGEGIQRGLLYSAPIRLH